MRNWEVTEAVKSLLKEYEATGVKGVEGTLSHQFLQNNLEAKKGLVAFPTASQRSDSDNAYNLEEGEVYGLNILVTDGERSVRPAAFSLLLLAVARAFSRLSRCTTPSCLERD